ncbi:hypothetical protein ACHAWT_001331 [Skeletonema menzelii]
MYIAMTENETISNGGEGNMPALWMKRLGMLIPGNASLKGEILKSPAGSSSQPTRRLSIEDVQDALRNMSSEASMRSDPPSILKCNRVYSQAIDSDLNSNGEAANNTVHMLKLLMMLDSFPGGDRVKLGLPASDSLPNTLSFKPDSSSDMDAVKSPRVNVHESKEEEDEGGKGGDNEDPLASLIREQPNKGHPVHPQANLSALLAYKPRRKNSSNDVEENASNTPESQSNPMKALASRASNGTSITQATTDSDSHREMNSLEAALESTMMKYKPKRIKSLPNTSGLPVPGVSDSFTTMISTGTFRDTQRRGIPTMTNRQEGQSIQNARNNSWTKLKEKSSINDDTSPINSTLERNHIFPSTGTFRDSAKRRVRTTVANSPEGQNIQKSRNDSWGKFRDTARRDSDTSPPNSTLERNDIFPSTGTFRDSAKRHVRTVRPAPNQDWDIKPRHVKSSSDAAVTAGPLGIMPMLKTSSVPGSIGLKRNTDTGNNNRDIRVKSRQMQQDTDEGNVSEPERQKNIFQLYMENKAFLLQQKRSAQLEASIPPKTAEVPKPAAKGELLVDWGDQGTDSEEEEEKEEEEENNGIITFVKNDSTRRISDITTLDDFDSDDDEPLDTSKEMRQRICSLSIAEEAGWGENHDHHNESNEGQNDAFIMNIEFEDEEMPRPVIFRSESEKSSASSETLKTSGGKKDNNLEDDKIKSVEMGKGLIRNMSAVTLHEWSDEEHDT